jgi:hypothetical protein
MFFSNASLHALHLRRKSIAINLKQNYCYQTRFGKSPRIAIRFLFGFGGGGTGAGVGGEGGDGVVVVVVVFV